MSLLIYINISHIYGTHLTYTHIQRERCADCALNIHLWVGFLNCIHPVLLLMVDPRTAYKGSLITTVLSILYPIWKNEVNFQFWIPEQYLPLFQQQDWKKKKKKGVLKMNKEMDFQQKWLGSGVAAVEQIEIIHW